MDGRFLNEVVAWKSEGETHLPNGRVFPRISYVKLPDERAAAEALSHEYSMATFAIDRGQPLTKEVLNDERQLSSRGDSALRLRHLPNACRTNSAECDPLELLSQQGDLSVSRCHMAGVHQGG
jgi:hypothetical protein